MMAATTNPTAERAATLSATMFLLDAFAAEQ
jgi:hypothetical protein